MKKISLVLGLTSLLISGLSYADYNTDALSGDITCKGSDLSVVLSANRSEITITQGGATTVYNVTNRDTDGDTEVTYTARMALSIMDYTVQLTLNDQGDQVSIYGKTSSLTCPQ